jgi:peptide deformylase
MILPIYTYGQPVLRKVAQDIPTDYPDLQQLISDMFETLEASSGVGLAAPQVGKSIRVVVIDLDVLKDDLPEYADFRHAFINGHSVEVDEKAG